MSELRVAPLAPADLGDAAALSTAVGWNQTRADWLRLLDLQPDGAFGAFLDGRLVATATIVAFPPALAWIGMVIVDPAVRGRRLGSAVMDAVLDADVAPSGAVIGLDATDLGAPLYERRGFVSVAAVDRWTGELRAPSGGHGVRAREVDGDAADALAEVDLSRAGVDRGRLLRRLLSEDGVRAWFAERGGTAVGYAVLRPGRTRAQLGPVVADDDGALAALLEEVAAGTAGVSVFVDAVRRDATTKALDEAGLDVSRRLIRMTRGDAVPALCAAPLRAAVGLEWG